MRGRSDTRDDEKHSISIEGNKVNIVASRGTARDFREEWRTQTNRTSRSSFEEGFRNTSLLPQVLLLLIS